MRRMSGTCLTSFNVTRKPMLVSKKKSTLATMWDRLSFIILTWPKSPLVYEEKKYFRELYMNDALESTTQHVSCVMSNQHDHHRKRKLPHCLEKLQRLRYSHHHFLIALSWASFILYLYDVSRDNNNILRLFFSSTFLWIYLLTHPLTCL